MNEFVQQIEAVLKESKERDLTLQKVLHLALAHFRSETGTVHLLDPDKALLHLAAEAGLPPAMLDVIRTIPVGKGIAGETAARGAPVTICNLQTDTSGVARPGARQTGVGGALCVPLRNGNTIVGTLGVGTIRQYQYTAGETAELEEAGRRIGSWLAARRNA